MVYKTWVWKTIKCVKILAKLAQFWWFSFLGLLFTAFTYNMKISFFFVVHLNCKRFFLTRITFYALLCSWLFLKSKVSSFMKELRFFTIMLQSVLIFRCFTVIFEWSQLLFLRQPWPYLKCSNQLKTFEFCLPKIQKFVYSPYKREVLEVIWFYLCYYWWV